VSEILSLLRETNTNFEVNMRLDDYCLNFNCTASPTLGYTSIKQIKLENGIIKFTSVAALQKQYSYLERVY